MDVLFQRTHKRANQKPVLRVATASSRRKKKKAPQFEFAAMSGSNEAVRAFMNNCLVTILTEEFLRRRKEAEAGLTEVTGRDRTTEPLGMEVGQ